MTTEVHCAHIIKELRKRGAEVLLTGPPDIIARFPSGQVIFFEGKSKGDKLSREQERYRDWLVAAGLDVFVVPTEAEHAAAAVAAALDPVHPLVAAIYREREDGDGPTGQPKGRQRRQRDRTNDCKGMCGDGTRCRMSGAKNGYCGLHALAAARYRKSLEQNATTQGRAEAAVKAALA